MLRAIKHFCFLLSHNKRQKCRSLQEFDTFSSATNGSTLIGIAKKLRTALIYLAAFTACLSAAVIAADEPPLNALEQTKRLSDTADIEAKRLRETMTIRTYSGDIGVDYAPSITEMAQSFPELKALLDRDAEEAERRALEEGRRPTDLGVVLVSFSMPEQSLREVAMQADKYGFTAVFAGLADNNFKTMMARLSDVFGDDLEGMKGFSINPTVFKRFNVQEVPAYIFLDQPLEPCNSRGCEDDVLPQHDIVYGNISFRAAAEIVARNGGVGSETASTLLARFSDED